LTTSDVQSEITEILYGVQNTISRGVQFMKNAKYHMDLYGDKDGPSIIVGFPEIYRNNYIECRKRGGRIRFITDINKDNSRYCKELFNDGAVDEFRHLEAFTGGIDLDEMILNAISDAKDQIPRESKGNRLELKSSRHNDLFIEADKGRINQVIMNLLNNAVKFTHEGTILIDTYLTKAEVVITITDTGIGIDSEISPRLFTKFATKSDRGTGLGLFISKSIIEAHGGNIWAKSNSDGQGATFAFSLPRKE
jgi:signal transduction histidine kinase